MERNFEASLKKALVHEGGFSNHKADPGGATMKGVTLATFRRYKSNATVADLKAISADMLARIYRDGYWNEVRGDDLPSGVDYAVFDFAVNSGPGRAAKYLQAACGVAQDGEIGPATLAAVAKQNPGALINSLCDARLAFMRRLNTWPTFGKGWSSRVAGVRKEALRMAQDAPRPVPQPVPQTPPPAKPALPVGNGQVFKIPPDNSKLPTSNRLVAFIIDILVKIFGRKPL